jgi:DNA polymerase V
MGAAAFKFREAFEQNHVHVFSTNFTLYGDFSKRVMSILRHFCPCVEVYSVDEAFLSFDYHPTIATDYAHIIRTTIQKWTGIPVSIGIGSTKTRAKAASELAKKHPDFIVSGVCNLEDHPSSDKLLEELDVGEVWGVGRQYVKFLNAHGIHSTLQLKNAPDNWVLKHFTIQGLRMVWELRGTSCISIEERKAPRKSILCSRTFASPVVGLGKLRSYVASFTARTAEKLREDNLVAKKITVFIQSNRFHKTDFYNNSFTAYLPEASYYTPDLLAGANLALDHVYKDHIHYKRAGVLLTELTSIDALQLNMFFDPARHEKHIRVMQIMDRINAEWGSRTLSLAAEQFGKAWIMNQTKKSKRFTTKWDELKTVGTL